MKKVLRALFHPVVLALLGLLAVALLIWYVGPLVAVAGHAPFESETARWVLIGLVLAAVVLKLAYNRFKAGAANAKFLQGLFKSADAKAEPAEVQTLRQRLEEAVKVLRQSQLTQDRKGLAWLSGLGRSRYLYELPWYMFIGAPGSGKTTALVNSGLRFPLADRLGSHEIQGVGGTRNCDWWFTDEAVLLDTAGRYTTQDSDQTADRDAWQGFLALLRRHRPRQPLNGVILTVSVADLLGQSASAATQHAHALRARLQELYSQLGVRLPVYVLLTKADLIAGFNEFFAALGQEGRDQAWGYTVPLGSGQDADIVPSLAAKLGALRTRVQEQMLARLQQETDLQRRGAIAGFDQQLAACHRLLADFLGQVLAPSGYDHPLLVRGVYFTSGTQEGNPIDRLMSDLGGAFGLEQRLLPPPPASGKSFFLTRLFREVVFAEQRVGGSNLKWEQRRQLVHAGALAALLLLGVVLLAGWAWSYRQNSRYVAEVEQAVAAAQPVVARAATLRDDELPALLPVLEQVAGISATPSRPRDEQPAGMGLGLFQGDKLDAAARQAHRALLRDLLLPRIARRLEQQLRGLDGSDLEFAYEALKAYRMLHAPEHFDAAALKAWIQLDWERSLPREVGADPRAALGRQLDELFASGPVTSPLPQDAALVARTRDMLLRYPLPQRIYSRLKRQGVGAEFPGFSVERAVGPSAALVFARRSGKPLGAGLPGLFTRDGYQQGFGPQVERVSKQLAAEEGWVLGTDARSGAAPAAAVAVEVRRLYLADYARAWEALLADIVLMPSGSLAQSVQLARVLSGPDSPLPRLLAAVARETTLAPQEDKKSMVDKAGEKLADARQELGKLLGENAATSAAPAGESLERLVDSRFAPIHQLVAGDPKSAPINAVIELLNAVYVQLSATETAIRDKVAPPPGDAGARVKAESARLPEPVRSMLQQLASASTGQSLAATRQNLSAAVGSQVGQFCRLALEGRYPFSRTSSRDVTREDFARLFAPGGLIDDFFQKNLAPFVDTSSRPWSFKKVQEQSFGGSANLIQFQRAATIREVFFRASTLRFDFKLLELDPAISQLTLEVDGQALQFGPAQPGPQSVQWPGNQGGLTARLRPAPAGSGIGAEGPWALFRLLDRARTEALSAPEKLKATFDLDGRRASFEVTAASVQNPLRLRELSEFRCPQGL